MTSQHNPFYVTAHHAATEDNYGVSIQLVRGNPFSSVSVTLPFDEFLIMMDALDDQRGEILAERQDRLDAINFELQAVAS